MRFRNELMVPWCGINGMENLFKDIFPTCQASYGVLSGSFKVNVEETENSVVLTADLPGISKKDLSIVLKEDILTISGERSQERDASNNRYSISERKFGKFSRSFDIDGIDGSNIDASLEDGVLTVILNKKAEVKAKKITIK